MNPLRVQEAGPTSSLTFSGFQETVPLLPNPLPLLLVNPTEDSQPVTIHPVRSEEKVVGKTGSEHYARPPEKCPHGVLNGAEWDPWPQQLVCSECEKQALFIRGGAVA